MRSSRTIQERPRKRNQIKSVSLERSLGQSSRVETARVQKELKKVSLFSSKPWANIVAIKKDAAIDIVFKYIMLLYFK